MGGHRPHNVYHPKKGYMTDFYRDQFILYNNIPRKSWVLSLQAHNDQSKPIYFWQLYSVIGSDCIRDIVTQFYNNVFQDNKNIWFSSEFKDGGTLDHHIQRQTLFWLDVMGGGKHYKGGKLMLHNHHKLVESIMNKKGADLWIEHMNNAIQTILNKTSFNQLYQQKIKTSLHEFIFFLMTDYSKEFSFQFSKL